MNARPILILAFALGALGVVVGAFGAHFVPNWLASRGVEPTEITYRLDRIEIGARYHMYHALALFGVGLYILVSGVNARLSVTCFTLGILLFSGSLYALGLSGARWFGAIVPLGGLSLILGWLDLIRVTATRLAK